MIAKQLTLLRDEVGPTERVVFLELPSAVYSVPKKSDNFIAQVRWEVTEHCQNSQPEAEAATVEVEQSPTPQPSPQSPGFPSQETYYETAIRRAGELGFQPEERPTPTPTPIERCEQATPNDTRTVDIVPRQSALNVNSIHETSSGFALAARFLSVFGFGAKVDYQRQRDIYDQFVYQDIFASGFGKGSNRFGWTFGALPGTKALSPGVRTTFAVVVIPASATKIKITGTGYAFPRSENQPDQSIAPDAVEHFDIKVPANDVNAFRVEKADYATVQSGKRVSLVLGGPYFSPQVGVLVNGVPLERAVAIAPIDLPTPPSGGGTNNGGITGQYEYVNSTRLIASFSLGNDYEGTPIISLVTPDKTSIINRYHIDVNHSNWMRDSLAFHALLEPMFLLPLAISKVEFVDNWTDSTGPHMRAVVTGRGFRPRASIAINGESVQWYSQRSTHQYEFIFAPPKAPSWDITIRQNTAQGQEEVVYSLNRPLAPQVTFDILRYTPPKDKAEARMDLRLTAAGVQSIRSVQLLQNGVLSPDWPCFRNAAAPPPPPSPVRLRRGRRVPPPPPPPQGTCSVVGGGDVLVTLRLPKSESNQSLVFLVNGDKDESAVLNILPPAAPTITSIVNDLTKKAEGAPDGGYSVVIHGQNLEQVDRVFFGRVPAVIQQSAPGVITVQAPKGDEGPVRVLLETNTLFQNKFLSNTQDFADPKNTNGIFTYVKPK